jgi:hypothetical protein
VVITGEVVSTFRGRHYNQVLALAPNGESPADRKEIILCVFEKPAEAVAPGTVITVAGYLDRASVPVHLILTSSTIVKP